MERPYRQRADPACVLSRVATTLELSSLSALGRIERVRVRGERRGGGDADMDDDVDGLARDVEDAVAVVFDAAAARYADAMSRVASSRVGAAGRDAANERLREASETARRRDRDDGACDALSSRTGSGPGGERVKAAASAAAAASAGVAVAAAIFYSVVGGVVVARPSLSRRTTRRGGGDAEAPLLAARFEHSDEDADDADDDDDDDDDGGDDDEVLKERRSPRERGRMGTSHDDGCSLFTSPRTPPRLRVALPLLLCANVLLFVSSNTATGATVKLAVALMRDEGGGGGSTSTGGGGGAAAATIAAMELPPLYEFSLVNTVSEMWRAKAYALASLIAVFSGGWPYLKLGAMLVSWFVPCGGCVLSSHWSPYDRVGVVNAVP